MRRALCISFDEAVSRARLATLRRAGYAVSGTVHPAEAARLLCYETFDLVVVGHRFPRTERHHLAELAMQKGAAVVLICGRSPDADIPASARVYALEGLAGLERALDALPARSRSEREPAATG